jgi:hypothetical protein
MKKLLTGLTGVCLAALIIAGCSTTPANVQTEQQLITMAAQVGTALDLQNHPTDAPYFIAAEVVLNGISGSTNQVNVASLTAALNAAGETNPIVTLAIVDALQLADTYIQQSGTNTTTLQQAAGWVATGIGEGVQVSASGKLKIKK